MKILLFILVVGLVNCLGSDDEGDSYNDCQKRDLADNFQKYEKIKRYSSSINPDRQNYYESNIVGIGKYLLINSIC